MVHPARLTSSIKLPSEVVSGEMGTYLIRNLSCFVDSAIITTSAINWPVITAGRRTLHRHGLARGDSPVGRLDTVRQWARRLHTEEHVLVAHQVGNLEDVLHRAGLQALCLLLCSQQLARDPAGPPTLEDKLRRGLEGHDRRGGG